MFPRQPPLRTLDEFAILHRLGSGALSDVFLARSRGGTLVAIKTLAGGRLGDCTADDYAAVFTHEASVCARLRHPCIVQVRAFLAESAFSALVFEYVPGVALGRVVRFLAAQKVRLPDCAAWHVVACVAAALAYAHGFRDLAGRRTPIVHRDVSPSNVLLDWTGGVKLTDFGIAKVLGVSPSTRLGVVKGTLGCMAPEQARGDAVDERADVYASALLAWRLATGRVPFGKHQKDEFEFLRAMRNPRIKPLGVLRPDLPEPLLQAIARALEPEAARRTISAAELAAVVRAHVDVDAGRLQLATLLGRWKTALEKAVKRAPWTPGTDVQTSSSLRGALDHTLRYEEVALAFDDDPAAERPTFEAHALPTEQAELTPRPSSDPPEEPCPRRRSSPPPPPAPLGSVAPPALEPAFVVPRPSSAPAAGDDPMAPQRVARGSLALGVALGVLAAFALAASLLLGLMH